MSDDSCIQCNSIVRMIGIFCGTDMIKKVQICLFEVLICLGTEMSHTGARVSWCWFVPVPKCLEFLVTWPQNLTQSQLHWKTVWYLTHWTFLFWTRKINKDRNHTNYDFLPTGICNQPFTYEGIVSPWTLWRLTLFESFKSAVSLINH